MDAHKPSLDWGHADWTAWLYREPDATDFEPCPCPDNPDGLHRLACAYVRHAVRGLPATPSPASGGETETGDGAVLTRAREAMRQANIVASLARSRYAVTETPDGWDVRALDSEAGGWGAPSPTATKPDTAAGDGVALISAERARQINAEGWTPEHDATHDDDALARAAACYAMPAESREVYNSARSGDGFLAPFPVGWPWDPSWWKPTPGDRVRELVKAGALIAAEIDRLRSTSPAAPTGAREGEEQRREYRTSAERRAVGYDGDDTTACPDRDCPGADECAMEWPCGCYFHLKHIGGCDGSQAAGGGTTEDKTGVRR